MSDERKIFLYFLTKPTGACYTFVNGNLGVAQYAPLQKSPSGWLEQGVSWGRSHKYRGLNRTFTQPFKFVDDGASIIRTLFYTKKGIEEPLTLIILKWNSDNDLYEPYYKGEVDLSKIDDLASEGVTVNVMEGGIVKLMKSYESTVFEFPCDGSIPENKVVKLDGVKFDDTFTYSTFNVSYQSHSFTMPFVFLSNSGYNANAANGSQGIEETGGDPSVYVLTSANWFYKYYNQTTIRIKGKIRFYNHDATTLVEVSLRTSKNNFRALFNANAPGHAVTEIEVDETMTVDNEAIFLIFSQVGFESIEFYETSLNVEFTSEFAESKTWAISAADLWRLIVEKIGGGKYPADSTLLAQYPNLMLTSGDAIRQASKAVLKTSLVDFYTSLSAILCGALSNQKLAGQNESLFFESVDYVFDSDTVTMDVGEVSDLKVSVATDYFFNTLKAGYPVQNYDEKAGRQEFNTTVLYKAPITRVVKELSLVSPYRADPFGITYTRVEYPGKSTTKNASDNSVFFLNVDPTPQAQVYVATKGAYTPPLYVSQIPFDTAAGDYFTANAGNTEFTFSGISAMSYVLQGTIYGNLNAGSGNTLVAKLYKNSEVVEQKTISAIGSSQPFRISFDKISVLSPGDVIKVVIDPTGLTTGARVLTVSSAGLSLSSQALSIYTLNRPAFDDISGVDNPETLFNIDMLTPARIVRKNGKYIRSVLHNQVDANLDFQTLDKNKDLITTVGGVSIIESASIKVSRLDDPIFYPYIISFKTQVPINFIDLMEASANGHIKLNYNGKTFFGFPLEVSVKPALNDAQDWKLLISPKTNLADLVNLDVDGLNYDIMGDFTLSIPHLCPVKFVPLNPTLDPHYHFVQMDADWFKNQVKFYISQANFLQPWQMNDTAKLQCRTNGLGPVSMKLYDCNGAVVKTVSFDQVTTDAVVAPNTLFEGNMAFNDVAPGIYAIVLTAGTGGTVAEFISEVIDLRIDWPMTLLLEYKNNRNKQSTVFSEGYYPSFRFPGWIDSFEPGAKFTTYEDQPADIQLLNGIPFRRYKLNVGTNDGVPPWLIDKINRIMLLTDTKIDGLAFTRNADAQFDKVEVPGWPMKFWSLDIREAKNRDSVSLSTDGALDSNLVVVFNINTKAFGDGSEDGVVQVTEVD